MSAFDPSQLVSAKELGGVLGISERRVHQVENQGAFQKESRGRYRLGDCVAAYVRFVRETETKLAERKSNANERWNEARARKLELQNEEAEGRLVRTDAAAAMLDFVVGKIKEDLAGVSAAATDDMTQRRRLDDAMDAALHALATRFDEAGAALAEGRDPTAA